MISNALRTPNCRLTSELQQNLSNENLCLCIMLSMSLLLKLINLNYTPCKDALTSVFMELRL